MLDEVYNARILALAASLERVGRLPQPQATVMRRSRLCGSQVTVDLAMEGGRVSDYAHEVKACALGQASAAIMARRVIGADLGELRRGLAELRAMLRGEGPPPTGRFAEAEALLPIRDYRARHASTLLAFEATTEAAEAILAQAALGA